MFNLTFLNAIFLAGMAAAIIPIVIHLLNLRRLRRVEFSDLRFIAPLNQQRMRSLNLRRLLLLALRVCIILLAALAMARPSVRGRFSELLPTQASSGVMLLIDTSYSMGMEGENGTAMDAARSMALRLLDALERGDRVNLVTFDDHPVRHFQTAVRDFDLVRRRIRELQPGHAGTDWVGGLEAALEELGEATEPNLELYLISDFVGADLDSIQADLAELQGDARLSFVAVRVEPFVNVSVEDVQVPPGAILRDEPVRVGVTVRNRASDVPADCTLQVELGAEPKGEASLRLGAEAQQTYTFTLVASQARELAGVVRKRIDLLPEDDVRYFVLPVLEELRVLFLHGGRKEGGSFYVSHALSPTREGPTPFAVSEVEAQRFSSLDLEDVRVVVVASDVRLRPSQAQVLADYVREGGGLTLLCGRRDTADPVNRSLLEPMGSVRLRGIVERQEGFQSLTDLRPTGILAGFREDELRTLENIRFMRYAEIATGSADARVVLRFAGGEPALVEGVHGTGKYMLFAFDADLEGSDLAVSSMFLPLLHRSVVYLAGETGRQTLSYRVGEQIEVRFPASASGRRTSSLQQENRYAQAGVPDTGPSPRPGEPETQDASSEPDERGFTVKTPGGRQEALVARTIGKMSVVLFEDTSEPGHYVFEGGGRKLVRAVNIDTRESDLRPFDPAELGSRLGLQDVQEVWGEGAVGQHVREARHGKELYKIVALVALLLLTLELFLSRGAGRSVPE